MRCPPDLTIQGEFLPRQDQIGVPPDDPAVTVIDPGPVCGVTAVFPGDPGKIIPRLNRTDFGGIDDFSCGGLCNRLIYRGLRPGVCLPRDCASRPFTYRACSCRARRTELRRRSAD